jgi:FtsP/CotA-like multicopper oxidase with cupredoxin domain
MDLSQEQAKEKLELEEMKGELDDIKGTIGETVRALNQISAQLNSQKVKEFHLIAKEAAWELFPGTSTRVWTYNGQIPGPSIRVQEGDLVRVVLHNQLKVPTSLHFHGMILPAGLDGMPRPGSGLVPPGKSSAYQFQAAQAGTFWYHPQIVHADQQTRGMYGGIIVEPTSVPKNYEKDYLVILGQFLVAPPKATAEPPQSGTRNVRGAPAVGTKSAAHTVKDTFETVPLASSEMPPGAVTYFTINGKCAPAIPPMEVHRGERVRLRVINASQQVCPIHFSGHKFEVMSTNGGDGLEPHVMRDSLAVQPGDRFDIEFSADNPGIWSLSSELAHQASNNGKVPGGMACIVRYVDGQPAK